MVWVYQRNGRLSSALIGYEAESSNNNNTNTINMKNPEGILASQR